MLKRLMVVGSLFGLGLYLGLYLGYYIGREIGRTERLRQELGRSKWDSWVAEDVEDAEFTVRETDDVRPDRAFAEQGRVER